MKLKNFLTLLFIACAACISSAYAGMTYTELLNIPWGEDIGQVKHRSYQGLHSGPLSFQVDNEHIIIFDTENAMLKTFNNKDLISAEKVHLPHMLDFYQDDENRYLLSPQRVYRQKGNNFTLVSELDDPKKMFYGFYKRNNTIQARYADGVMQYDQNQFSKAVPRAIYVTRTLPETVNIQIGEKTVFLQVPNVGSVDYLGSTPDKLHYIYAESITRHVPLSVARYVYLLDEQAHIMARIFLPQQQYTYIFREFYIGVQGELYHMHSSKDGIHIIRWEYHADIPETDAEYPEQFNETYHFNEFIEQEPETEIISFAKASDGVVTRTQALVSADEYVRHIWTATASNIGTTSTVTTPSWIQIGQNQRIPYKWGGWSTIAQFDAGITDGKLAGDINTTVVDWGNSVGADCSGFVSVCWNTSKKYGTSTFYNCSSQLSNFNNLLPGDATNKAGSHIRMFVEWTNDGKLVQIEETSSGSPGWAARYYTWSLSQITDYVPIRYNNIQNIFAPRPTFLAIISKTDSVTLSWTADESFNFTGYKIYRKQLSAEDYTLAVTVPKGIKTTTLAQVSDVHYDYKVASYHEDDSANELASDIYSVKRSNAGKQILIVDGFDRTSGSYISITHAIAAQTAKAINTWDVSHESCANEAIISGDVDLKDYEMVWWILGDESTADETFNSIEQDSVESYLKQGGKLFVSGSELAWDLDSQGSAADKAFIHNYLKTVYAADDAGNYLVSGATGSIFASLSFQYSNDGSEPETYAEDYPDVFSTTGGSVIALKYSNSQTAAVSFDGNVTGATAPCKVMVMGFPFETISTLSAKGDLAGYILRFMGYNVSVDINTVLPEEYILYQNYPNPFNPMTTLGYTINLPAYVELKVFNLRGELVADLVQAHQSSGHHEVIFNGTSLPSGMYVYRLDINNEPVDAGKMVLSK